ncbi:Ankyrin repeat protein [Quillaja saponaria]|uniref:Ankyrin repeat protein n=1 Tax=Quillaja saponaria TaxID=32244 RepID=A0AAD7M337_QUISA|nr:Ankyrin repeat protein [Quillaja saponaria]
MNDKLKLCAQSGDIDCLYTLIQEDPHLLEHFDAVPFIATPLHVAASDGNTQVAIEIMRIKPSFSWKLNQHGFSPIHLALQNMHTGTVLRFVNINKDLVRVKGREGLTPLHFATQNGDIDLLAKFLSLCPESIEDVNIQSETALHIAVKCKQFEALQVLVGWLWRTRHESALHQQKSILNRKDESGNTILHISALANEPQVVRLLLKSIIDLNAKNLEGWTAFDIVENQTQANNKEIKDMLHNAGALGASSLPSVTTLADKLRSDITFNERIAVSVIRNRTNMSNDTRNALLVVAVLIATTTYQAVLSPPGGISQDDQANKGKVVMDTVTFLGFWFFNTTALLASTAVIYLLLPSGGISKLLFAPLYLFSYCYVWSMAFISPNFACFFVNLVLLFLLSLFFVGGTLFYDKVTKLLGGYSC